MISLKVKQDLNVRLNRVKGQIEGVQRMLMEEKYCIDVINQINAARRGLEKVALQVMGNHMESCVADAIRSQDGEKKIRELIETIDHFVR